MKILQLILYSNKLTAEKKFYSGTLGFKIFKETLDSFTLNIGWSQLIFKQSKKAHNYHYCFLIPSNKLEEALNWIEKRTTILNIENDRKIQHFETWNADSFYFYDATGNIAEFIVRHDLKNQTNNPFSIDDVICVNEIGLPTTSIKSINAFLEKELNTSFWKGNKEHFGTNGTQEGLFLLPNYKTRTNWFPTTLTIVPSPFKALIENNDVLYDFEFIEEIIKVKRN